MGNDEGWSIGEKAKCRDGCRCISCEARHLRAELAAAREDVVDAAGELLIDVPPPGSDMAKVLVANKMLRRELAARDVEIARLRESLNEISEYATNDVCMCDCDICEIARAALEDNKGGSAT